VERYFAKTEFAILALVRLIPTITTGDNSQTTAGVLLDKDGNIVKFVISNKKIMNRIIFLSFLIVISTSAVQSQCITNVNFNPWIEEGNPANGDWVVGGGGTTVSQNINTPEPTFFVSPDTFINVIMQGSITTPVGDDDYVGFVFGYKEPIGNSTNYDCWLFDWKQGTQTANGYTAQEGKAVNHIQGNITTVWQYFWGHTNNPPLFDVVATDWGAGTGWVDNTTYSFTLVYTTSQIIILIDADTIFDINGCFEPGRFGFYNFSQASVTYANFDYSLKANFDVLTPQICIGDTGLFQYIDTSCTNLLGFITSWNWDFGDGNTSASTNPFHAYSNSGTYPVQMTITNNSGCQDSVTKNIVVQTAPVANFSSTQVCLGTTTDFTDSSSITGGGSIVTYQWDFGDGSNSTVQNPTNLYNNDSVFNVSLTVTSDSGCIDSVVLQVQVFDVPIAGFTATDMCLNDTVFFSSTSIIGNGVITSWSWDFGDGNTSTTENPWHLYSTDGIYSVSLIVTSGNSCSDTIIQPLQIFPAPIANFTSIPVCFGNSTVFNDQSSGPITSWDWIFGDGSPVSNDPVPIHTYIDSGVYSYNATLIVTTSNGCSDNITVPVEVNPLPIAAFTNTKVCLNEPTQFSDSSTVAPGSILSWQWNFGDGSGTSTNQYPNYTYGANGSYNVLLTVTTDKGCTDDTTVQLEVFSLPTANFNNTTVCPNFNTDFIDLSSSDANSWLWDFDDGSTSFLQFPSHTYTASRTYNVQLIVSNSNGCVDTTYNTVTAYPEPTADFQVTPAIATLINPQINFSNSSTGATSYQWDMGDGYTFSTTTNTAFIHLYSNKDTGTYTVWLIVENTYGCVDSIAVDITIKEAFTIFLPNAFTPNGDGLNEYFIPKGIGFEASVKNYKFYIYNRWGDIIFETSDIKRGWDGTGNNKDKIAQEDVYIWLISVEESNSKKHQYIGHVSLLK